MGGRRRERPGLLRLGVLVFGHGHRADHLVSYTWALIHYLVGGLRHSIWDLGYGYEKDFATKLPIANAIGSVTVSP